MVFNGISVLSLPCGQFQLLLLVRFCGFSPFGSFSAISVEYFSTPLFSTIGGPFGLLFILVRVVWHSLGTFML